MAEVRTYLDIREINGYSIQFTPFHPASFTTSVSSDSPPPSLEGSASHSIIASTTIYAKQEQQQPPISCLVYIGLPENPQFLGSQDPDALASHILKSRGPSGENREYLFLLEKALLELSRDSGDAHISDLVRRCKAIEAAEAKKQATQEGTDGDFAGQDAGADVAGGGPLHKVGSTEEQEEVEK